MSSNDASFAATYTSISSEAQSWGIPIEDPYEEAARQALEQTPHSPVYVPNLMKLEDHASVYVPELKYPKYLAPSYEDIPIEDQPLPIDTAPVALSPGYIADSNPKEDKEDHADHPANEGDDNDDDESSDNDDEDDKDVEEEEEHLAPTDSTVVAYLDVDLVPFAEETKSFKIDESVATPPPPPAYCVTDRMFIRSQTPILFPFREEVARLLALHTPRPSPLTPLSSPLPQMPSPPTNPTYAQAPLGCRAAMMRTPPLLPIPLPTPSTSRRAEIFEDNMLFWKRLLLTTLTPRFEVGESSTAGAARRIRFAERRTMATIEVVNLRKMVPKRINATTTTTAITDAQHKVLIARGVVDALAEIKANRTSKNGDDSHDSGTGRRRTDGSKRWNMYSISATTQSYVKSSLQLMMIDKYCPRREIKKLEVELWNLKVKGTDVVGYNQRFQEFVLMRDRMFPEESDMIEKLKTRGNLRTLPGTIKTNSSLSKVIMWHGLTLLGLVRRSLTKDLNLCSLSATIIMTGSVLPNAPTARGLAIRLGTAEASLLLPKTTIKPKGQIKEFLVSLSVELRTNPNSNIVTSTFLLNNRYASILFDTGADRSFMSATFSSLIDIIPTTLDHGCDVDLADGLAGYYRRFIEGFSKVAKLVTRLTQKKVAFKCGDKQEAAFQTLKDKLCSAPILALPKGAKNFVV
nr:putative reverse transcriptase domain-containing protein [Tanacetum cinerariifolium]GEW81302.1 putative reverse transcriptase domain-containing protein [Tanacetum cinerariifolium]